MSCSKGAYVSGVLKGLQSVLIEAIKLQDSHCRQSWNNSIIKNAAEQTAASMNEKFKGFSQLDANDVSSDYLEKFMNYLLISGFNFQVDKNVFELLQRSSMILEGLSAVVKFAQGSLAEECILFVSYFLTRLHFLSINISDM